MAVFSPEPHNKWWQGPGLWPLHHSTLSPIPTFNLPGNGLFSCGHFLLCQQPPSEKATSLLSRGEPSSRHFS